MKRFLICLFILPYCLISFGQITVKGTIVSVSGKPVEYVSIGLKNDSIGTISDRYGNFTYSINKGHEEALVFTHVSYQTKSIPFSVYASGKPIVVELADKEVELPDVAVLAKDTKIKKIEGKGLRGPSDVRFIGRPIPMECGPIVKPKKNMILSRMQLTVNKCTYSECTLSFNIYEVEGKNFTNILSKPLYYTVAKTEKKFNLTVTPSEDIIFKRGHKYYVGMRVVDQKSDGFISFPVYMRHNYARRYILGKRISVPIGIGIDIQGKEL